MHNKHIVVHYKLMHVCTSKYVLQNIFFLRLKYRFFEFRKICAVCDRVLFSHRNNGCLWSAFVPSSHNGIEIQSLWLSINFNQYFIQKKDHPLWWTFQVKMYRKCVKCTKIHAHWLSALHTWLFVIYSIINVVIDVSLAVEIINRKSNSIILITISTLGQIS